MSYLLGTNIVSELVKRRKNPGLLDWLASANRGDRYLSVITLGEIRRGIHILERRNDHGQATRLEDWLAETTSEFADRIVPVTVEVADRWGRYEAERPMPTADALIGATAEVHGWTLVTRNTKDFEHLNLRLLNPFTDPGR